MDAALDKRSAAPPEMVRRSGTLRLEVAIAPVAALGALYALVHPFVGVVGDSKIYMGRALADVDPGGVGRDLMFRLDGQSGFSLFPKIAAALAAHLSLLSTAVVLVAVSSILWFVAALWLTRCLSPQKVWLRAAVALSAPAVYGGFNVLKYAESLAEPRPFAEAFVILALAAFLADRRLVALLLLGLAAAFHPLMAAAGVAAIYFCLCVEDRRWVVAGALGCAAVVAGAALGAPLAERLGILVDPAWLDFLIDRNAYLFPQIWPSSSFILPAVQAATIVLAAANADGKARRILLASLAAGLLGLFAAWIAAVLAPSLLVLQLQTWRMWWLTAFVGALALGLCAVRLGTGKPTEKVALALLALSWTCTDSWIAPPLALMALLCARPPAGLRIDLSEKVARWIWIGLALAVFIPAATDLTHWNDLSGRIQPGYTPGLLDRVYLFGSDSLLLALVMVTAFGAPKSLSRVPRIVGLAATAVGVVTAVVLWNDATSYDLALARTGRQADLQSLVGAEGEVLWLDASLEPWVWLGLPSWNTNIQGAGSVFSRSLSMIYRERAQFLIDQGLGDPTLIARYPNRQKTWHPALTVDNVTAVCRRPDAPSAIIAAVDTGRALDPALKAKFWTPPAVRVEPLAGGRKTTFARIDAYAVIACADHR